MTGPTAVERPSRRDRPLFGFIAGKRSPISRPVSRTISNRRILIASIRCDKACHLHSCRLQPHPFSRSAGCEPNRASHPSGSSVSRCTASALAACAAPEKRWCQAVSKGLLTVAWLSRWRRQSATGSQLGRFSNLHSFKWRKDGVQSVAWVVHQTAFLAHRLWPFRYAKHRLTSKGFCSRSMW
jgi:hypothetical protein